MRGGPMRNRLLASGSPQPPRERSEPRLLDPNAPRALGRLAGRDPAILPLTTDNRGRPATAPVVAASDRPPTSAAGGSAGVPRHLAVAGSIAFALAGIGSAGFLLLTNPAREAGSAVAVPPSASLQTGPLSGPVAGDTAVAHAAANSAVPQSPSGLADAAPPQSTGASATRTASPIAPAAQPAALPHPAPPAAVAEKHAAASAPQTKPKPRPEGSPPQAPAVAAATPARPTSPSPGATPPPEKPASAVNPEIAPARVTDRHQEAETEPPRTQSALSQTHRIAHMTPTERHRHLGSGHETRSSSISGATHSPVLRHPERSGATAQPAAAQPGQAAAFDQLLQHLTGSAKPANPPSDAALSPPDPRTPDPFAPHPPGGSPDQ
jgi:hypothetical protein